MTAATVVGLALALAGAVVLDLGFALQHHAASRMRALTLRRPLASLHSLFGARRWLAGFLLGLGGWALYLIALGRAPLSLVQAVSASGVGLLVLGLALARRRWPARREGVGALVTTLGLAALGLSLIGAPASHDASVSAARVSACVLAVGVAALMLSGRRSAAAGGTAAGLCYGLGDVGTKAFLVALPVHAGVAGIAADPYLYVALAGHGAGFLILQRAFQRGGVVAAVAPMTAAMNLLPMVAGIAVLGDPLPSSILQTTLRVGAFAAAAAGAGLLAWAREDGPRTQPAPPDEPVVLAAPVLASDM